LQANQRIINRDAKSGAGWSEVKGGAAGGNANEAPHVVAVEPSAPPAPPLAPQYSADRGKQLGIYTDAGPGVDKLGYKYKSSDADEADKEEVKAALLEAGFSTVQIEKALIKSHGDINGAAERLFDTSNA
jgi:hypothetical protein